MEFIKKNALIIVLILIVIAVAVYLFIKKDKDDAISIPQRQPVAKPPVSVIQNTNDPYFVPGGAPKPANTGIINPTTGITNPITLSNTNYNITA